MLRFHKFLVFFVTVIAANSSVVPLQCYICKDCEDINGHELEECPLRDEVSSTMTTSESPDFTDWGSGDYGSGEELSFGQEDDHQIYALDDPELHQYEQEIDSEELQSEYFRASPRIQLRELLQVDEEEVEEDSDNDADTVSNSDARCVVASFEDTYGNVSSVRGCTYLSNEEVFFAESHCRRIIGGENPFMGDLRRCLVCNQNGCNSATKLVNSFCILLSVSYWLLRAMV